MPDESSEANDVLGQMRFPQFSRLLPYRDYDAETGLFMNEKTMGFMLEAQPSTVPTRPSSRRWKT